MKEEIRLELKQLGSSLIDPKYKNDGFTIPEGYFDTLSFQIESQSIGSIAEDSGIPEGYFEQLESAVFEKIDIEKKSASQAKVIRWNWSRVVGMAASFAALVFVATWIYGGSDLDQDASRDLLVEVETSELIDYLHENDEVLIDEILSEYDLSYDEESLVEEIDDLLEYDDIDAIMNEMSMEELEDLL